MERQERVGYHDLKAYTQLLSTGKYQGFVLVKHHTLAGIVQTVFHAGRSTLDEAEAFAQAEARMERLTGLLTG